MSRNVYVMAWLFVFSVCVSVAISDLVYGILGISEGTIFLVWGLCFFSGWLLTEYLDFDSWFHEMLDED
jgi:hypothetical protein